MTLSSFIAMMVFADFGIGNGLMNAVAEAHGRGDKEALRGHIENALVILGLISITILVIFFSVYHLVDWARFFNVKTSTAIHEAGPALLVLLVCFALDISAGIVQRVQLGLQEGFANSIWQAGGSVLGLLTTLLAINLKLGLPWLVAAMAGSPLVVMFLNGFTFLYVRHKELFPNITRATRTGMKRILHGGLLFFVLQLGGSIAYASDNIIIAKMLGATAVAQYSVVSKLFEGILMIQGLAITPLWPAYAEAKACGDKQWIQKTLLRSMWLTLVVIIPVSILLVAFNKPIFSRWVGSQHVFPFALVASYGGWMVLKGLGATYSMFLNGLNVIRFQVVVVTIFVATSITLKVFLVNQLGLYGMPLALMVAYFATVSVPYVMVTNKILKL